MEKKKKSAAKILSLLANPPWGRQARIIGAREESARAQVILNTAVGTRRIVDMLTGDPLPRIC